MITFVLWTLVAFVFVTLGVSTWKSQKPAGFFSGIKPPAIPEKNVKLYNHAVGRIWFVFSLIFEVLGIPLILFEQNSPYLLITIVCFPWLIIGIIVAYLRVQNRYMKVELH